MAPRLSTSKRQRGVSTAHTSSSRRPRYPSSNSAASTPVPRAIGVQKSLPPVSRVGPARQSQAQLPLHYDRLTSVASNRTATQSQSSEHDRLRREVTPDDDDDAINEIVMAFDIKERGTVGCAYYVAAEAKLYFMEDVKLGGADIVEARKCHEHVLC